MSSGINAGLLRGRAISMLEGAKWRFGRGEYDLACFEAEQAAQLYVKYLLLRFMRGHPSSSQALRTPWEALQCFEGGL